MSIRKAVFIGVGLLLIDLIISLYFFVLRPQIGKNQENVSMPKLNEDLTKSKQDLVGSQIVKKTDSFPEELKTTPSQKERFFSQDLNGYMIRTNGTLKKVLIPNKTYSLYLDSQENITVLISEKTLIAKAWFGFDKNNNLVRIQYKTISLEEFNSQLRAGKKVSIGYAEKDFIKGKDLPIIEFVLME